MNKNIAVSFRQKKPTTRVKGTGTSDSFRPSGSSHPDIIQHSLKFLFIIYVTLISFHLTIIIRRPSDCETLLISASHAATRSRPVQQIILSSHYPVPAKLKIPISLPSCHLVASRGWNSPQSVTGPLWKPLVRDHLIDLSLGIYLSHADWSMQLTLYW